MNRFVWAGRAGLLWMALAIGTPALAAEPTLNQVYEAVHAGRLNQAHGMMTEVLRDHPNSAKAHYVEAEILAKEGRYGEAQGELNRAEQLAPGRPFAAPASVQELRGLIASAGARQAPIVGGVQRAIAPAAHESSFPWGLLLIVLAGGVIVYAIVRARRNAAVPYSGAASGGAAASGTGVPAAQPVARDLMGGHGSGRDLPRGDTAATPADNDLGGQDFGISDAGSWDDGGGGLGGDGGGDWG